MAQDIIDTHEGKARHPVPGKITYRVINLAAGEAVSASINASGQVAYSVTPDGFSPITAFFYDGRSSRNIGSLANTGDFTIASGITSAGEVIGSSYNSANEMRTFIWNRRAGIADIGTLPGTNETYNPVVNSRGVITGHAVGPFNVNRAFRWSRSLGLTDLGVLATGEGESAYARAINDAGAIAGDSWTSGNAYHSFLWTFGTGMVDIHTNDSDDSAPVGVSAKGHVAGNQGGGGNSSSFYWTPASGMIDIAPPGVPTWLTSMSASGQITGLVGDPFTDIRAMTWTQAGGLRELGTLGGEFSNAVGANNKGQVIGSSDIASGQPHAFVWTATEGMVDLNTRLRHAPPGLVLEGALAISDNGAIVAVANTGLVLLKPVDRRPCACLHTVGPIQASVMVAVGAPVSASVSVAAERSAASYGVTWNWGDGNVARSASTANTVHAGGAGRASASHSYTRPGIYTVTAKVADGSGTSADVSRKIVAYARGQGMAAGAGAFVSPLSAGHRAFRQAGTAHFSFIAPAAAQAPSSAPAALHFSAPGLNLVSRDIRPVTARGAYGQFEGNGAANGRAGYRFTLALTASDNARGEPGRFRLKIWHLDRATGKAVVDYDNGHGNRNDGRVQGDRASGALPAGASGESAGTALAEGSIALY
jgi:probable HAF family extracellular repeat protein